MTVPVRYIFAALAFGVALLGLALLPTDAAADCNGCNRRAPPPPPPPAQHCHTCNRPTIVVPPPHVPPPNIVVVNAGARAQASATAIAIANASTGDTIIRNNMVMDGGGMVGVQSAAFAVTEQSMEMEQRMSERMLLIQAICVDTRGTPHPASQTFGERDVRDGYAGEIFRCMAGTRMRYTIDGRSYDCEAGEALWYENGQVSCKPQIARRPCNERSLLRRYGPGEKMVRIREMESRQASRETTFQGAMTMDGGVGQGVW